MSFETNEDFLNARLHGMRSVLMEGDELNRCMDDPEDYVRETLYPAELFSRDMSHLLVQKIFLEREMKIYQKIHKYLSPEDRIVVEIFYEERFLENLRILFKFWHRQSRANIVDLLTTIPGKDLPDVERLLSADSISEFARFIEDDTYTDLFLLASRHYKSGGDTFRFETYLENLHFRHFYEILQNRFRFRFSLMDKIYNTRLDIINLMTGLRLREYYRTPWSQTGDMFYHHTGAISEAFLETVYPLGSRAEYIRALPDPYRQILISQSDVELSDLEIALNRHFYRIVSKGFYTTTHCLGKILCYIFLKNFETQNLISIIEGKRLGTDRTEIVKCLIAQLEDQNIG